MKKMNAAVFHSFLRAFILLGFGALIVYLKISGDILLYVTPRLSIYLEIAAAGLMVTAAFQFYISFLSLKKPVIVCECGHDHDHEHGRHSHEPPQSIGKNVVVYGIFILPLLFGTLLPNTALAGSLAQTKGMNLGGVLANQSAAPADLVEVEGTEDPALKEKFKTTPYNRDYAKLGMLLYQQDRIEMKDEWYIEKMRAMNTFVDNFENKQIKITGFVYREDGLPDSQFIIGRLAMTHCIADIAPYGIIVEGGDANQYANDSWITVTGTISKTSYHDQKVMKINISSVEPAKAPSVPYVYPDWDFASKL
ncbi:TIGR03943 family putative permease subunit [Paenibacillus aestuarii]|uniref:TIGR03943 family putative permease subunit n=1 Tax=Paenibacillus aestuarii TaxID=516965 RepID=A0ABW0K2B1_9BACL|nr:TIGR03943 family protein [Paenibacillus aestuarii]